MKRGVPPWDRGWYLRKATDGNLDGTTHKKKGRSKEEGWFVGQDIEFGIWYFLLPCLSCSCVPSRGVYLKYLWSKWITVAYLKAADKQLGCFQDNQIWIKVSGHFYRPCEGPHGVNLEVGFMWTCVCLCVAFNSCSFQVVAKLHWPRLTSTRFFFLYYWHEHI